MKLCDINQQIHEREPYIGVLDFDSTKIIEKDKNYEILQGMTFIGVPVKIYIQNEVVTNIEID